jgi:hypothetical protein
MRTNPIEAGTVIAGPAGEPGRLLETLARALRCMRDRERAHAAIVASLARFDRLARPCPCRAG